MAFTAKDVQALREKTGCGMMDCKKALVECDGDVEKAIELEPENGNHYTLQAILYERLGKREAAKKSRINAAKYNK